MLRSVLQVGRLSIRQPLIQAETCLAQQTRVSILKNTNQQCYRERKKILNT